MNYKFMQAVSWLVLMGNLIWIVSVCIGTAMYFDNELSLEAAKFLWASALLTSTSLFHSVLSIFAMQPKIPPPNQAKIEGKPIKEKPIKDTRKLATDK